jgi:hypothetical protein
MANPDVLDRLFGELATADLPVPASGRVVARGRQRRRRARGRVVIAAAAVAVIVAGVTQFPRLNEATPAVGQHSQPGVCVAAPNPALNSELSRALPASQQQSVSVFAVSPNGAILYLQTTTAGFHGIAAESVATGAILQRISPFAVMPNYSGVWGGLGPNGEVVWSGGFTPSNGAEIWTNVIVWSPRPLPSWMAREPTMNQSIAIGIPNQDTETLSAPVFSGRSDQLVAWEAPGAQYGSPMRKIVEADLLTGVTAVVASGYVGAPVFVGGALVWPVASTSGGPYHLVAASASTFPARQRVAVPLPLRKAGAATAIASSGGATVYASADLTKLFYSPSLSQPARQVLTEPNGSYLAPGGLAVGPRYLAWTTAAAASYVASAKTLAATRITDGNATFGVMQGLGGYVLASRSASPKTGARSLYLLSGSVIGGSSCARSERGSH